MRVLINNDVITVTCSSCNSELAVECDDVESTDIGHGHSHMQWVNCCVCGKEIGLSRDQIPNHWLSSIFQDDF